MTDTEELLTNMDEIVSIMRNNEQVLEQIEQLLADLVWQGTPFWRRCLASWRDAKSTVALTEHEGEVVP
jgi:hypothetical protein